MAGTVTQTDSLLSTVPSYERSGAIRKIALAWTSDASGNAGAATSAAVTGTIAAVTFAPGAGGAQPTDAYDIVLTDAAGVDVLSGQGANLSNATATAVCPGIALKDGTTTSVTPRVVNDVLTLVVSNAGNTKSGVITIFTR